MKDYLDDLLVWAIILAVLIPMVMAVVRRKRVFIVIFGVLMFLGALPISLMSELSIAPSTGYEGVGYLIGGLTAVAGILLIVFSSKLAKH